MIFLDAKNKNKILNFIPLIQGSYSDWHMVTLNFNVKNDVEAKDVMADFMDVYRHTNGFIYQESDQKAFSVVRLGKVKAYGEIQEEIERNIKGKKCKVLVENINSHKLKQIRTDFLRSIGEVGANNLFVERQEREKNVILIADDDMFIRKTLNSLLEGVADIHEVEEGDAVLPAYQKVNPDIVILDIHMPNQNGLDVIDVLNEEDPSAFILISSADAIKGNVLESVERGAVGFLAKPVRKEKMFGYLEQCVTFRKEDPRTLKRSY